MTTEFDKLLAQVQKLNKIEGEECMICHFPDSKDNLIKLDCNHFYHKDCIKKFMGLNISKCPYCNTKTKLVIPKALPKPKVLCFEILKSGPNKGMPCGRTNCKYHKIKEELPLSCNVIIKSGPRKGMACGRTNCKYHKKTIELTV